MPQFRTGVLTGLLVLGFGLAVAGCDSGGDVSPTPTPPAAKQSLDLPTYPGYTGGVDNVKVGDKIGVWNPTTQKESVWEITSLTPPKAKGPDGKLHGTCLMAVTDDGTSQYILTENDICGGGGVFYFVVSKGVVDTSTNANNIRRLP